MGVHQILVTAPHRKPVPINRARLEALIADAIEILDLIDGDPDLEDDDPDVEHDGGEQQEEDCN